MSSPILLTHAVAAGRVVHIRDDDQMTDTCFRFLVSANERTSIPRCATFKCTQSGSRKGKRGKETRKKKRGGDRSDGDKRRDRDVENVRKKRENRSRIRQQHNQVGLEQLVGPTRARLSRSVGSYIEAFSVGAAGQKQINNSVSCPRIADRPADPFSDLPNSTMDSPARLPLPLPLLLDSIGALEEASSRQKSVVRTSGTSGTNRSPIARSQETRAGLDTVGFELTELSRIVLLQAIVPESSRSQASCQCGNT
nr:PREDICTED: uncharacterized protein LOC105677135 [Linepithema humile]